MGKSSGMRSLQPNSFPGPCLLNAKISVNHCHMPTSCQTRQIRLLYCVNMVKCKGALLISRAEEKPLGVCREYSGMVQGCWNSKKHTKHWRRSQTNLWPHRLPACNFVFKLYICFLLMLGLRMQTLKSMTSKWWVNYLNDLQALICVLHRSLV